MYSKSETEYWNKEIHLAVSFDDTVALLKLKSLSDRIRVPLISSNQLRDSQESEVEHLFKKDSIIISLRTKSIKSNVLSTKKYSNEVEVRYGRDKSNYKMIGFCRD